MYVLQGAIIADDDDFFRLALSSILKDRHGFSSVSEVSSIKCTLEVLKIDREIGIAFLDLNMPGMTGMPLLTEIRLSYPSLRLVIISASVSRQLILTALEAGVHGYISKVAGPLEVSRAIGVVLAGDIYVPASLADPLLTSDRVILKDSNAATLTQRQREVLGFIIAGASNREIATQLSLGEGTVKVHVAGLLRALNVRKRSEAARMGARWADS